MRPDLSDALLVVGALVLCVGIGMYSIAAALIAAGLLMIAGGAVWGIVNERNK